LAGVASAQNSLLNRRRRIRRSVGNDREGAASLKRKSLGFTERFR